MDTKQRLQQRFEELGFTKTFPKTLYINPSTNYIWQQFLTKVKPKKDIEVYRKNLIINRIQRKTLENPAEYPIREIETYNKLKNVKDDVAKIKAHLLEKQNRHMALKNSNNANYILIKNIKEKNEEKKIKLHAIKLKSKQYEKEINQLNEMLAKREISSLPVENSVSPTNIYENLQCIVGEIEKFCTYTKSSDFNQLEHTFSKRNMLSIQKSSKAYFSTAKKHKQKEDLQRFVSCNNLPTARALFTEVIEENEKTSKKNFHSFDDSGEILSDSFLNFDADDEFLLSTQPIQKRRNKRSGWNITPSRNTIYESNANLSRQAHLEEKPESKHFFDQVLTKKNFIANVDEIITIANRELIWNTLRSLLKNTKLELEDTLGQVNLKNKEIGSYDLVPLNFMYIKNKLLYLKSKKQIRILEDCIRTKLDEIKERGNSMEEASMESSKRQIDTIKLKTSIRFLHKEVYNDPTNTIDHETNLKALKTKLEKLKNELRTKVEEIGGYIEIKEYLMDKMKKCQENTTMCVRKMNKFLFNPSWADSLSENLNSKEMEIFQEYPMDFIKHFCFVDKETLYRDSMRDFSLGNSISSDALYEVASLLRFPHNPSEKIIEELVRRTYKLQTLSSLEYPDVIIPEEKYHLADFEEKEMYIKTFSENTNICLHSDKVRHIMKSSSNLRLNMELWLDMPFRHCISKERLVDDKTYAKYEEELNYIRNNT